MSSNVITRHAPRRVAHPARAPKVKQARKFQPATGPPVRKLWLVLLG